MDFYIPGIYSITRTHAARACVCVPNDLIQKRMPDTWFVLLISSFLTHGRFYSLLLERLNERLRSEFRKESMEAQCSLSEPLSDGAERSRRTWSCGDHYLAMEEKRDRYLSRVVRQQPNRMGREVSQR